MPVRKKMVRFTQERRQIFLRELARTGIVTLAAKKAGVSRQAAYDHKYTDTEFASAWEQAEKQAADLLEAEARRRAYKGVLEPVHYQGKRVDMVRRYSDTLLIFLLKGCNKEKFGDRVQVAGDQDAPVRIKVERVVTTELPEREQ